MASKNKSKVKKDEAFEDELESETENDEEEDDDDEDDDEEDSSKPKSRKNSSAVEDEDDEDDEDDDEEEVDDDEEEASAKFAPWIYTEEADWDLDNCFKANDEGDDIIIYDPENNRWWKLNEIQVGEITPEPVPES